MAQVGAVETLRLIESDDPIPKMSCGSALLWRERLLGHLDPDLPGRAAEADRCRIGTLTGGSEPHHVVIYLGGDKIVQAPQTGENVRYGTLSEFSDEITTVRRITRP